MNTQADVLEAIKQDPNASIPIVVRTHFGIPLVKKKREPELDDYYRGLCYTRGIPSTAKHRKGKKMERIINEPMVDLATGKLLRRDHPSVDDSINVIAWDGTLLAYLFNPTAYPTIRAAYQVAMTEHAQTKPDTQNSFPYGDYAQLLDLLDKDDCEGDPEKLSNKICNVPTNINGT
jgi:hypothetical protein